MTKMNLGCGLDYKEGWVNTNIEKVAGRKVDIWDAINEPIKDEWRGAFDEVLINHVLTVVGYGEAQTIVNKAVECLKDGGNLVIIEMDVDQAIFNRRRMDYDGFPGFGGSIDDRFCRHLIGHGRKSIWTNTMVEQLMKLAHLGEVWELAYSEYDLRPKESLIVRGIKNAYHNRTS